MIYASTCQVAVANPSRVIKRLCNHWAHKFEVQCDEYSGEIQLTYGRCQLNAKEQTLNVSLQAHEQINLETFENVVASHLQRMASEDELTFNWQRASN